MIDTVECCQCGYGTTDRDSITLKCHHIFCWMCIHKHLQDNLAPKIKCPIDTCWEYIRDSIIRRVLSEGSIARYEEMCLRGVSGSHKCILEECSGSIIYTNSNTQYECPCCTLYNCISCKASHTHLSCTEFLKLTEQERIDLCQAEKARALRVINEKKRNEWKRTIMTLEEQDFLRNNSLFECPVCNSCICKDQGVMLRNCFHQFCKECLIGVIKVTPDIPVKCPVEDCEDIIIDQDITSVLTEEDLGLYILRNNESLKKTNPHYLQCQSPNCSSFYDFTRLPDNFTCVKCKSVNCVRCRAVHPNVSCQQYQINLEKDPNYINIRNQLDAGEIIKCPYCQTILKKMSGCNWIQCSNCSLEICWLLKIPRWGPKGRDDTSGGCKCGVDDKPCHKDCWINGCTPHHHDIRNLQEMLF